MNCFTTNFLKLLIEEKTLHFLSTLFIKTWMDDVASSTGYKPMKVLYCEYHHTFQV